MARLRFGGSFKGFYKGYYNYKRLGHRGLNNQNRALGHNMLISIIRHPLK